MIESITPARSVIEDNSSFDGIFDLILGTQESKEVIEGLLQGSDIKCYSVEGQIESKAPSTESPASSPPESVTAEKVRAPAADKVEKKRGSQEHQGDIDRLDHMMNLVEDLVINRGRLEQIAQNYKIKELDETLNMVGRSVADLQVLMMDIG